MVKLTKSRRRRIGDNLVGGVNYQQLDIPEELDWRKKGFVTRSLNQLDCGSCYAFSIVTAIEGQLFKQSGQYTELSYHHSYAGYIVGKPAILVRVCLFDYSPQQIVDCSTTMGNYGCSGGSLRNTLRYLERSGGLMTASEYPYTAKVIIKYFIKLDDFVLYPFPSTGVYDDPSCSSDSVNHAVVVVGYTKDVWILKNWWSDKWGEDGYMRLARHKNQCGITNYAAYSIL
uniref:Peptidase C1A papain C-terminal domain-containing protein n=1 Tax=Timema cristinae TaxID=61476 RepID=A0A7R9CTM2_TIMCR|nr:unnamed protein product [Timema cristinae]